MAVWNTGDLAMRQHTQQGVIDRRQSLAEIVRRYQEKQLANFHNFISELGIIGYCINADNIPIELLPVESVKNSGRLFAPTTYGEHRRSRGLSSEIDSGIENGFRSKRPKLDDGWGDEEKTAPTKRIPSSYQKTQPHAETWTDDENKKGSESRRGRPINYMSSGWSDDENGQQKSNDRYRAGNERFRETTGFGDRGRDGGARFNGRGRGRGGFDRRFESKMQKSDRFNNSSRNDFGEKISTGWSDDESDKKNDNQPKTQNVTNKPTDDDDWDNDKPVVTAKTPAPTPSKDPDDWD